MRASFHATNPQVEGPGAGRAPNPYHRSATVNAPSIWGVAANASATWASPGLSITPAGNWFSAKGLLFLEGGQHQFLWQGKHFQQRGPLELVSECRAGGCRSGAVSVRPGGSQTSDNNRYDCFAAGDWNPSPGGSRARIANSSRVAFIDTFRTSGPFSVSAITRICVVGLDTSSQPRTFVMLISSAIWGRSLLLRAAVKG
jgi:hypothetical protein